MLDSGKIPTKNYSCLGIPYEELLIYFDWLNDYTVLPALIKISYFISVAISLGLDGLDPYY